MSSTTKKLAGAVAGLAVVIPLILLMFIGPASRGAPHDLPIGVAGPQQAVDRVAAELGERQPGAFDVRGFRTADHLEEAVRDREVYGGFVFGPSPRTVIATGASPIVATMLTQIGESIGTAPAEPRPVADVAPPAPDDPRSTGFNSLVIPVFMAGMGLGIVAVLIGRRRRVMAAVLPIGAAAVGATAIGLVMVMGVLDGGFWPMWLAMAVGIWAIGAVVAGVVSVMGMPGLGVVALVLMIVGMPLAGTAAPPEFLPSFWATVGQSLPLGATGTALRSAAFFAPSGLVGAGAGVAFGVLVAWLVVGYALMAVRARTEPAPEEAVR
ncbi:DUF3533 domain-containing protein [Gordonia shandongensis]|uniref:DUF3533 domain-containing protein n=1 Tax=Gordonia shandongensis TaxID=376351 RepID=UPI00041DBBBB|nr:DUF3533 domain-containing protein [Gordonia shandongensis]